jgi:hypothetical protein
MWVVAQYRMKWKALVDNTMNLPVKDREFDYLGNISFSQ